MQLKTNFNRFKEPRGFIKVIQFLIAILAFSTTAGYDSGFKTRSPACTAKFGYAFGKISGNISCYFLSSNFGSLPSTIKSSAQFFVFVGVMSFLYCIVAMVYYVCFEDPVKYGPGGTGRDIKSFASLDFAVTLLLTLFWFCGSIAWAVGVAKLKDKTDAKKFCKSPCNVFEKANYAGLIISLLFGFLSCFLWGFNSWFAFKETVWHKEVDATNKAEEPAVELPRQEVPGKTEP